ncbi:MAG: prenyltransferase [Polyangiaceae bacterium]
MLIHTAMALLLAFVRLSRLKFLFGGVLAFALGAMVARFEGFTLGWAAYVHGQVMVTSFHVMVHYANDYYDRLCDVEGERTPWSGGSGVLVDRGLHPNAALFAALLCGAAGLIATFGFALEGAPAPACAGIAIAILAWSYSAPPLRLSARGFGELDTAVIVAMLFPLAGYLTFSPRPDVTLVMSTLPAMCAMFVLMFCVEYPDADVDLRTGKLNLVARLGRSRARVLVYCAVAGTYVTSLAACAFGATLFLPFFVLLTIPLGWGLYAQLRSERFRDFPQNADIAARGVAFFVATILGSALAYAAVVI